MKKVILLLDRSNLWIEKYISYAFRIIKCKNFKIDIKYNLKGINKNHFIFPINYTKIFSKNFLSKFNNVFIVHASNLPKDKGFAPVINQILRKQNKIYISLFKAVNKVDHGPIFLKEKFLFNGHELYDEIRKKQAISTFKIINNFLKSYRRLKPKKQTGKSSFNKKRRPLENKLNINKSIKSQFNILRVSDNINFPSFFIYKNKKYIFKIFKS